MGIYMSVAGYIGKNVKVRQIPRVGTDEVGISYGGAKAGRGDEERAETVERSTVNRKRESYESVEDYDPVLRSHCRL
jgi:hypothetical protein